MGDKAFYEHFDQCFQRINELLADLPAKTRVDFLARIWLNAANVARHESIAEGGVPAERARQLDQLEYLRRLIAADGQNPDEVQTSALEEIIRAALDRQAK